MKKLLNTITLCTGLYAGLYAQTRPQQSIYPFNAAFLNPAAIGMEAYAQVQTGTRRQWVGIDGAPTTNWLIGIMPLGSKNQLQEAAPFSQGHGLGISLYNDKIGPYSTINFNLGYAYHLPVSSSLVLSGGFWGGVQQTRYDLSKSIYPDQPIDPATISQSSLPKKYTPDLSAGLMLLSETFFAGISAHQLIPSSFINAPDNQSKFRAQWQAATGYRFNINEEGTAIWLTGVVKSDFANPARFDIDAKFWYQNMLWFGTSYRKEDAFGAGVGLSITKSLSFGYMYEWGIAQRISAYSQGSHELCIGFKFLRDNQGIVSRLACPRML
jgi:type IX secretion system PorP/SprF family membrane protein